MSIDHGMLQHAKRTIVICCLNTRPAKNYNSPFENIVVVVAVAVVVVLVVVAAAAVVVVVVDDVVVVFGVVGVVGV